jgi:hypothetical protein
VGRLVVTIALIILLSSSLSQAQIFSVVGAVGGSLLLGKAGKELRDSIDDAREAGFALLDRANQIGKERLDQIDTILQKTVGGLIGQTEASALRILAQAKKDIDQVRENTFADLKGVIWQAECAGRRFVISDLQQALGGLGVLLNTHEIRLTPPIPFKDEQAWYCTRWWCADPNVIQITEPFGETYVRVRERMEASIADENIQDTTPAHKIVGTWEYLSSFALKTSCFYPGSEDSWNREYVKYREMAHKWRNVASIVIE